MAGNHDNTEIAKFIVESLGLDLSRVTKILNSDSNFLENYVGTGKVKNGVVTAKRSLPRRRARRPHLLIIVLRINTILCFVENILLDMRSLKTIQCPINVL